MPRRLCRSLRALATRGALLGLLVASSLSLWPAQAAASSPSGTIGVYRGARNVAGVQGFESWLGRPVNHAVDFIAGDSWSAIESPTWWTSGWNGTGYQVEYSIPIIPSTGGTLQAGAGGDYNSHFVALAHNLIDNGQANATLRPGWEFNGSWYKWSAASDPAAFAAYWRQIVNAMRSVPGQHFEFDWCPTLGKASVAPDRAYPGDAYVDYVGADVYDNSWIANYRDPAARWNDFVTQPYGLQWQSDFAAAHGKPMTFPEWGLSTRSDGHGGGDDPYFIQQMYDWIRTHDVAHADYFEYDAPDGRHSLMNGQFPNAAAKFRALFGAGAGGGTPDTGDGGSTGTQTLITSPPAHTRRGHRGSVKGTVRGASAGKVTVALEHRVRGQWDRVAVERSRVIEGGRFSKPLRSFRGQDLRRGMYRAQARYKGCQAAAPSKSPFHRFEISH